MIRHLHTLISRLRGPWIADDPHPEPSHPDAPVGEVMPEHVQRALRQPLADWDETALSRIDHELRRMCDVCDYIPEDPAESVITHHPTGAHVVTGPHDVTRLVTPTNDFDRHADEAIALVSPWTDADRAAAAAWGVAL